MTAADLSQPPPGSFNPWVLDGSQLEQTGEGWCFSNLPRDTGYTDSQIDDYQGLKRRQFPWSPPLTLTVRARFSHREGELKGTAGFGFWNDPFVMTDKRPPALPRALWFFYGSEENNLKLDREVPGHGWKAATVDALRLPFFLLAPTVPLAVPLMNIRPLYRALWPIGQKAIGVREALVQADMTQWHTYQIKWQPDRVQFSVDDQITLEADVSIQGRLGFIMWIDNQAMAVTPTGRFGWRVVPLAQRQWMQVSQLVIVPE